MILICLQLSLKITLPKIRRTMHLFFSMFCCFYFEIWTSGNYNVALNYWTILQLSIGNSSAKSKFCLSYTILDFKSNYELNVWFNYQQEPCLFTGNSLRFSIRFLFSAKNIGSKRIRKSRWLYDIALISL